MKIKDDRNGFMMVSWWLVLPPRVVAENEMPGKIDTRLNAERRWKPSDSRSYPGQPAADTFVAGCQNLGKLLHPVIVGIRHVPALDLRPWLFRFHPQIPKNAPLMNANRR